MVSYIYNVYFGMSESNVTDWNSKSAPWFPIPRRYGLHEEGTPEQTFKLTWFNKQNRKEKRKQNTSEEKCFLKVPFWIESDC